MPVPDSNLIYCVPVQTYFVDKTTGAPLSAGVVTFYEANTGFTVPKNIYQQSNTPPYTFTVLSNPITLSGVGTFQDGSGNDINVYLYPYVGSPSDATRGAEQLYDVTVYSSGGTLQETRFAWPPNVQADFGAASTINSSNQITNSQFIDVLFETPTTFTVNGPNVRTEIAPGWFVLTSSSGAATFTVSQTAVASGVDTNNTGAPYELTIASASLDSLAIYQRITGSPLLLAGGPVYGYAQIASVGGSQTVSLTYEDSSGNVVALTGPLPTDAGNAFTTIEGAATVPIAATGTAPTAYVDFVITLIPNITFRITSVEMLSVANVSSKPGYFQESVPEQINGLYWYDKPNLFYKPIPSYLTGWDFPLNPTQELGATVAATAIGANKSKYVWDQTIIFQSADSGVGVTRGAAGEIVLTAAVATQMALVQYLDATQARELLNNRISVNIAAKANVATNATVSLWYTTDVTLPVITSGTNNSIVLTLGTNGSVATRNGTWSQVPRSGLGDALMTIGTNATNEFNDYNFSGWDMEGIAATNTATFFAIVIGTASKPSGAVRFYSVGLCAGDIATRPAPQTPDEVLRECQYYYEKSYDQGVIQPTTILAGAITIPMQVSAPGPAIFAANFSLNYNTVKRMAPIVVLDDTQSNLGKVYFGVSNSDNSSVNYTSIAVSGTWTTSIGTKSANYIRATNLALANPATATVTGMAGSMTFQYSLDSRLGVV